MTPSSNVSTRYVIVNNQKEYFSRRAPAYERKFSTDLFDSRMYETYDGALNAVVEYFPPSSSTVGIAEIELEQQAKIIKNPDFSDLSKMVEAEIEEFEELNTEWLADVDRMSVKRFNRWKLLRSMLSDRGLLEIQRDEQKQKYWTIKRPE